MLDQTAGIIDDFYDAWNRHDAAAIVASFAESGRYADPLTRVDLGGDNLTDHVQSVLDVIRNLQITATRTISDEGASAVADALRLQTIVEPFNDGAMTFGHSMRSWVSKEKPGALGMTWLLARDETEKLAIRARARDIITHFREVPGFIGIVTGFAGLHGFTLTAWESEEALRVATHSGAHSEAMHAFRADELSGGVFTSVWAPIRLNRMWIRCSLGHPNDATRADGTCEVCGKPLPEAQPYL